MIEALREFAVEGGPTFLAIAGLLIGTAFGFIVFTTNFCAMGSISDIMSFGNYNRFRAWLLAAGVAIIGAQLMYGMGIVDLDKSMYLSGSLNWLGNSLGGFLFGVGMIFAGGCASKNLVRTGGGDMRSLVVLMVMGLFAYITVSGLFGHVRDQMQQFTAISMGDGANQSIPTILNAITGIDGETARLFVTLLFVGAILYYCFKSPEFRSSQINIISGVAIGLTVVAAWAATGLAYDEFSDKPVDPTSLTYVRPTGDFWEYLRRFTADMIPGFGVATVFGALLGGFLGAKYQGKFELIGFANSNDTLRNLGGAALMGIGGVTALGCTVGQAVTGVSTLALGSVITFAFIVIGGIVGMRIYEQMLMNEA